mmetsp:Transcript_36897/g.73611  ORF Transcript_36897/g.73611 Transcript_36897/m.73611 type:complete len:231 (+) Transcript_36897:308-1000(+)
MAAPLSLERHWPLRSPSPTSSQPCSGTPLTPPPQYRLLSALGSYMGLQPRTSRFLCSPLLLRHSACSPARTQHDGFEAHCGEASRSSPTCLSATIMKHHTPPLCGLVRCSSLSRYSASTHSTSPMLRSSGTRRPSCVPALSAMARCSSAHSRRSICSTSPKPPAHTTMTGTAYQQTQPPLCRQLQRSLWTGKAYQQTWPPLCRRLQVLLMRLRLRVQLRIGQPAAAAAPL